MTTEPCLLLFLLLTYHGVADYALQNDFMARGKNPAVPETHGVPWWHILLAHAAVHAFGVAWLTGSWVLGLLELIVHAWVDYSKCRGWLGVHVDQGAHLVCKLAWWSLLRG